ncbi:MAG TPA: hypothetical protein VF488_11395, partial [Gemmatimonadaceae bacterium]
MIAQTVPRNPPARFRRRCLPDRGKCQTRWKCQAKLANILDVSGTEALAASSFSRAESRSMALLAVACPLLADRFDLDVPAATQPAGPDHRGVDATGDLPPCLVEDLRNPLVEPVIGHVLNSSRIGLLIIAFRVREVERACASSSDSSACPAFACLRSRPCCSL